MVAEVHWIDTWGSRQAGREGEAGLRGQVLERPHFSVLPTVPAAPGSQGKR